MWRGLSHTTVSQQHKPTNRMIDVEVISVVTIQFHESVNLMPNYQISRKNCAALLPGRPHGFPCKTSSWTQQNNSLGYWCEMESCCSDATVTDLCVIVSLLLNNLGALLNSENYCVCVRADYRPNKLCISFIILLIWAASGLFLINGGQLLICQWIWIRHWIKKIYNL